MLTEVQQLHIQKVAFLPTESKGFGPAHGSVNSCTECPPIRPCLTAQPCLTLFWVGYAAETTVLANGLKEEKFVILAVHPGFVITDMGNEAASLASSNKTTGYGPTLTVEESVSSMLSVIGDLTFALSGSYVQWDGQPMAW